MSGVMPISRYVLRCWLRHLKPPGLCLLMAARQLAFERGEDYGVLKPCFSTPEGAWLALTTSVRELALRAHLDPKTVRKWLRDNAALGVFLRCGPEEEGSRILLFVRKDDPLVPAHERAVAMVCAREAEALCALSPAQARRALERRAARRAAGWLVGRPQAAQGDAAEDEEWRQRLREHLLEQGRVFLVRRAFWQEWLPKLGATQAALLFLLRSRCYYSPQKNALRDTCQVSTAELAGELGCSQRQVRRLLGALEPFVRREPLPANEDMVEGNRLFTLRVLMWEPGSEDEEARERALESRASAQKGGHLSPASGHLSPESGHPSPVSGHLSPESGHPSLGSGHLSPESGHLSLESGHPSPVFKDYKALPTPQQAPEARGRSPGDATEHENDGFLSTLRGQWRFIQQEFECRTSRDVYYSYLRMLEPVSARREGERWVCELCAPGEMQAEWVNFRFQRVIVEAISMVLGCAVEVRVRGWRRGEVEAQPGRTWLRRVGRDPAPRPP